MGVHSDRIKSEDTCNDPKDVVFYEVTLSVDETYLITGNIKHFPVKPFKWLYREVLYVAGDKICLVHGKSDLIEYHVFRIVAGVF